MARLRMIQQAALLRPWISSSRSGLLTSNLKYTSSVGCPRKLPTMTSIIFHIIITGF